jgi:stage V sporulation protein D (sporulation-specific penicillin-binding protein)
VARKKKKKLQMRQKKFPMRIKRKVLISFWIVTIALIVLIFQIVRINVTDGAAYAKTVLTQQSYNGQIIPYKRGNIVDANGTVLASSEEVYNVILDCKVVNTVKNGEYTYRDTVVDALADCLEDYTKDDLYQILEDNPDNQYYVLAKKVSYDSVEVLIRMKADSDTYPLFKGVWFETQYERNYPNNSLAASVIGFTSEDETGLTGLEASYDDILSGTNGRSYGYLNSDSNLRSTTIPATNGKTIVSTIDINIQSIVEKHIRQFNQNLSGNADKNRDGSDHTAVLVVDPNDGSILAMANYPTFDLNNPRDLSSIYTEKELEEMTDDETYEALNQLWSNFCISYTYEPGSTVKPFTVAAGLETGALTGNETYLCDGSEEIGDHVIHCVKRDGHGILTIAEAIMNSCNDCLMQMARQIGKEDFMRYQKIFNFGLKTNIDLPSEARTDSLIYTEETMNATALATNSFGQNFNVTMIQVASAFCSLINGGYYYEPHVVSEIQDEYGNTVQTIEPKLLKQTISEDTQEKIMSYLKKTVDEGSGNTAKVEGYSMGGKTGTAQKLPRTDKTYLVSFIGYVPAEDPQVLIYVVVDEPNDANQAQSTYATTLAKDILTDILPYMNIYPDEETEEETTSKKSSKKEVADDALDDDSSTNDAIEEENKPQEDVVTPDEAEEVE